MKPSGEELKEPGRETRLPFSSDRYRAPNGDEIRAVIQALGITNVAVGQLLGVTSATVSEWVSGQSEITYSAWRLLLIHAGLAQDDPSRQELEEINAAALADLVQVRDGDAERAR